MIKKFVIMATIQSVEEARVLHDRHSKEKDQMKKYEKEKQLALKKRKEAEDEEKQIERKKREEESKHKRKQLLQELDPAGTVFNYVREKIEEDSSFQQLLLNQIKERGSTKFDIVWKGPAFCGGYFYTRPLKQPEFMHKGKKVTIHTYEYEAACYENMSRLYHIIQRGPFKDWRLRIDYGTVLFGLFGYYTNIVLEERRWYHLFW